MLFLFLKSRFANLKNSILPNESNKPQYLMVGERESEGLSSVFQLNEKEKGRKELFACILSIIEKRRDTKRS